MAFSPERCADLHNKLLQKAIENSPAATTETNLLERLLEASLQLSQIPGLQDMPVYRFLSLLKTTPASPQHGRGALTPQMYQPDPALFWSETFSVHARPELILLYGQNNAGSPMDGGLFLNVQTGKAVWHWAPGPFPADEQWVSLEDVLRNALAKWDSGKYFWDATQGSIGVRSWVQKDLSEALAAWERLLCGIEARLPVSDDGPKRLGPLELTQETMSSFRISRFVGEFISRAPRPGFAFVAPGITAFSTQALQEAYSSEDPTAIRRSTPLGQEDPDDPEWASLLLPAGVPVDQHTSRSANIDIQSFDKPWGPGKFTVGRQAGLYVIPETTDLDVVHLITSSGLSTAGDFSGRCPWAESRPPRLAETLSHWASLVESGAWAVAADGVAEDHEWFSRHSGEARLDWHDHSR
ncbi:hypothetical protein SLS64_003235 [Diaporthe eres]|uniref:Knr4/Smi1-like domain-containing protein n=1 Tax=Diaporthe eres TaxID=83184 RepID=A0ABR1NPP1_DIAER